MKLTKALTVASLLASSLSLTTVASAADPVVPQPAKSYLSTLTTNDVRLAVDGSFAIGSLKHNASHVHNDEYDVNYEIAHRASVGAFGINGHAHYFFLKNPSASVAAGVDVGYSTGSGSVAADNYVISPEKNQSLSYQTYHYGLSVFSQFNTNTYFLPFVKVNVGRLHTDFNDFKAKGWYYGADLGASLSNGFYGKVTVTFGSVKNHNTKHNSHDKYQSIGVAVGYSF